MAGGIAPPAGAYCELHLVLVPADDDAINLTATPPEEIDGHTALISGHWRAEETAPWQPFLWTSEIRTTLARRLTHPKTGEHPLYVQENEQILLLVDKQLTPSLFESIHLTEQGLDFSTFVDGLLESLSLFHFDGP
jgi:hypothetical protein